MSSGVAPKFFKFVIDPNAHKLRIPREFTKRHGQSLPSIVFLKVPSGSVWQVELCRSAGETWLQKGWQEFKEFHSLGFGHMVLFEYDGDSCCRVLIFDLTASEIDYPLERHDTDGAVKFNKVPELMNSGSESDDSVVFVEEISTHIKGKRKQIVEFDDDDDDVGLETLDNATAKHRERIKRSLRATPAKKRQGTTRGSRERSATSVCSAYQTAKDFMSNNQTRNPFYISVMQPSYVSANSNGFGLRLPLNFAKENLPKRRNILTLCASEGIKWSVVCNINLDYAKISQGWKVFLQDNDIKMGDVCVFEVVKISPTPEWNVTIFRA